MTTSIQPLDVVAQTADKPERGLLRGEVGTVVEVLALNTYEVEFADQSGKTYAVAALQATDLIVLHYEPSNATG
ncbi:MAG: DUF4926 domain-containing protein [Candidatus Sumerlaeia bacterium]|nr:DUF4926 domain-containing protein [Candidatus Sumerlaeia bacterium]